MARRVKVELIGDASSLNKAFKSAGHSADNFGKHSQRTKRIASTAFKAMGVGALAGGFLIAKGLKSSIEAAMESQKVMAQTRAVLQSTGGAAKVTAKHVGDLAQKISQYSGIDDEAVQATENMLLTFTKVRNETGKGNKIFDQATKIVTDMSVALGQDSTKSAIQLGKALNDPIKGVGSLRRVGVAFTEQQVDQMKVLVKHGKLLQAQKIILHELGTEFGGSAYKHGKTFTGQMELLKVNVENLQERIGNLLLPVLTRWANKINHWLSQAKNQRRVMNEVRHAIVVMTHAMKVARNVIVHAAAAARAFKGAVGGWKNAFAIVLGGFLVFKLLKVYGAIKKIRREMILTQQVGGLGAGGGMFGGGRRAKGGKGKNPLAVIGKAAVGYEAVYQGVKAFSGEENLGHDFSSTTAGDTFVGKNPYPKGSPGFQAFRAGARGMAPGTAHTVARDPAYQRGLKAGHHEHIHIHVDGREIAKVVKKHDRRDKRRTTAQRGGRHPGQVLN